MALNAHIQNQSSTLKYGQDSKVEPEGAVEFDASRTTLLRKSVAGKVVHAARIAVSTHRDTGERFFAVLMSKTTEIGARPPPESRSI